MKQLSFDSNKAFQDHRKRIEHGGTLRQGKRKLSRPFNPNKALHLVMRSSKAKGEWSLLKRRNENQILGLVYRFAAKNHVTVYKYANSGNHLHILLKARSQKGFKAYLRTISGLIARHVSGAKRGDSKGKFWDGLAYTKLISWGRHFKSTINYVWRNALEGWGIIPQRSSSRGQMKLDYEAFEPRVRGFERRV